MATTTVPIKLPAAPDRYSREDQDQIRRIIERAVSQSVSVTTSVSGSLPALDGFGASGGYLRSDGSNWVRVSGLAAADLTGTIASGRISGSYTGITGVGTLTAGTWNGTSISTTYTDAKVVSVSGTTNRITSSGGGTPVIDISGSYVGQASITTLGTIGTGSWQGTAVADAYVASASTWNAKVDRAGDTMTGPLGIDDETSGILLHLGDPSTIPSGFGVGGLITANGDFRGHIKDMVILTGKMNTSSGALGFTCQPDFYVNDDSAFFATGYFGPLVIDNTPAHTGATYHVLHIGAPPTVTGTIDTVIGFEIYDQDYGVNNWAIKTGAGLVSFGDNVTIATGKTLTSEVVQSGSATNLLLKYNTTTKVTVGTSGVTFADKITVNDTDITRAASGIIGVPKLGVGNYATATVGVGTIADKIEVFDLSGNSLGFIPVYASIT